MYKLIYDIVCNLKVCINKICDMIIIIMISYLIYDQKLISNRIPYMISFQL